MMVNGEWVGRFQPVQGVDEQGGFVRQASQFRRWVGDDPGLAVEPGRYHLYVTLICPWACRTLMVRALLGLEAAVSVSTLSPRITDQGWAFLSDQGHGDPHLGVDFMHQLYRHADPGYTGRATVPVLWDKAEGRIVNNESADIIRMLNGAFRPLATRDLDLYPADLGDEIDALNDYFYRQLNNGVYRAGFATTQAAYETAYAEVFEALDRLEARLRAGGYVLGDRLTETDVRLFVTLVRFDLAYHGLFKCNRRRIVDYPAIGDYLARLYRMPGVAATVDPEAIKQGYYSIEALNPSGIVPQGPARLPFEG